MMQIANRRTQSRNHTEKEHLIEAGGISTVGMHNGDPPKRLGKIASLAVFVYNCTGVGVFTLHMTLGKIGLFWAVAISAGIVACNCYAVDMLEWTVRTLETEQGARIEIENTGEITRLLNIPWLWIANCVFVIGTVCSVQADALTDLTLVATNLKLTLGIDTAIIKFIFLVTVNILLVAFVRIETLTKPLAALFAFYTILGNLTMNQC